MCGHSKPTSKENNLKKTHEKWALFDRIMTLDKIIAIIMIIVLHGNWNTFFRVSFSFKIFWHETDERKIHFIEKYQYRIYHFTLFIYQTSFKSHSTLFTMKKIIINECIRDVLYNKLCKNKGMKNSRLMCFLYPSVRNANIYWVASFCWKNKCGLKS